MTQELFECPICYQERTLVMKTPCGHEICGTCCYRTINEVSMKCPLCRAILPNQLNQYEITTRLDFENLNMQQIQEIFPFICANGNINDVKQCIELFDIDVNQPDNVFETTSLLHSCKNGHFSITEFLVQSGADVNQAVNDMITPLLISSNNGYLNIVKCLVQNDADVNKADSNGLTPLLISSQQGHLPIVEWLVKNGADVNHAADSGYTALMMSSKHGHFPIVECLVQNGADVNQVNKRGVSPLWVSCLKENLSIVECLVQNGANVNQVDQNGMYPLFISSLHGNLFIVECLLQNGAAVNRAAYELTPLSVCIEEGHEDVAELLRQHGAE